MMKILIPTLLSCLLAANLSAQSVKVLGAVLDEQQQPLVGAYAIFTDTLSSKTYNAVSDLEGRFVAELPPSPAYILEISYIGYKKHVQALSVDGSRERQFLGRIALAPATVDLEGVQVTEQALTAVQKGDTTEFNASAFKTTADADAQDLLEKMPTVKVEGGQVQAQGEQVRQVLVDGKPFFGNDPQAALRNLPAEVIERIQIYDQQSDQSRFTGFDDGNTSKTINIITKPNMRAGQFGKVYAGYGDTGRYRAGGNVNIFDGQRRISLIGMSNNVNQQNFATEDLLGVLGSSGGGRRGGGRGGPGGGGGGWRPPGSGADASDFLVNQSGGISQTHAFGINYTDKWAKGLDVAGSYFFNYSDNTVTQAIDRNFVATDEVGQTYTESSLSNSQNTNHRATLRFEWEVDSFNSFIFKPNVSWQGNVGASDLLGQTLLGGEQLNLSSNDFDSDLQALNLNGEFIYRHRFAKERRTISLFTSGGYAPQKGESYLLAETLLENNTTLLNQQALLDQYNWNYSANLTYSEPVGQNGMLMFGYRHSYRQDNSDRSTFAYNEAEEAYSDLVPLLSNVFSNDYVSYEPNLAYNFRKGRDAFFMVRASAQWASLSTDPTLLASENIRRDFFAVLPFAIARFNLSRTENLRVFYRGSTDLPSLTQLQAVLDNANPLLLRIGNPALDQSVSHQMSLRYSNTNTETSSVFFAYLNGAFASDYIANSTFLPGSDDPLLDELQVPRSAQLSRPVNLDGYWNARAYVTYGFPLKALKSNLNMDVTTSFTRTPGLVNNVENRADNTGLSMGLTLSSNISERLDFTISTQGGYNTVRNQLQANANDSYYSQNSRLRFTWIMGGSGIVFRTDANHQYFDGLAGGFDQNFLVWNMSLGKKLFKDDRGEISIGVFDLLNQNNSLTRTITETYFEDVQTNALQRYLLVSFSYDIRHFGVSAPAAPSEERRPPFF